MKNFLFAIIGIFIFGCMSNAPDHSAENIALVEKYVHAVESRNHDIMESLLADDYLGLGPSYRDSTGKADAIANWKHNIENLYESIKYNRSRYAAVNIPDGENKGEWVSNWAELEIKYKDGRGPITIWANTAYEIKNGKIVKSYTFYNEADALRQLGYVFIHSDDL